MLSGEVAGIRHRNEGKELALLHGIIQDLRLPVTVLKQGLPADSSVAHSNLAAMQRYPACRQEEKKRGRGRKCRLTVVAA